MVGLAPTPASSSRAVATMMCSATVCRFGGCKAAFGAALLLLHCASAHVTFKLPSLPGVSPGNAGGYGAPIVAVLTLPLRACGQRAERAAVRLQLLPAAQRAHGFDALLMASTAQLLVAANR